MKINIFCLCIALLFIGCQKDFTEKPTNGTEWDFNAADAQEWFQNHFKQSAEYAAYDSIKYGKKDLLWKKPSYGRSSNVTVVSFPLIKQKHSISSAIDTSISKEHFQKMLEGSFTRILFSRKNKNEISVRQLEYVPEYYYLASKNFSRSAVEADVLSKNSKYCGSIVAKKWSGQGLSVVRLKDGKIIKAPYTSYR